MCALLYRRLSNQLVCVTREQNLVLVDGDTLTLLKTLVGYNDEITDVKYVPSVAMDGTSSRTVAVATNSDQVRCAMLGWPSQRWFLQTSLRVAVAPAMTGLRL